MAQPKRMRPKMKDYGINADGDGLLEWAWVSERMAKTHNYWVCSTRPDGRPHAAPVWGIWHDETFYFYTGLQSRKGRNIQTNPDVVVHLESGDETVIFEGTLTQIHDEALQQQLSQLYGAKYPHTPDPQTDPLFKLQARVVLAWLEQDFPKTCTRWQFDDTTT